MISLPLASPDDTARLGRAVAAACAGEHPEAILLYGPLGSGKTTLAAALVRSLPGGDEAEPSSPSFTICNIYCTSPLVHHFDLYRLGPNASDEALEESLDQAEVLTLIEWSEYLAPALLPDNRIVCRLLPEENDTRSAALSACGPRGERCLDRISRFFSTL